VKIKIFKVTFLPQRKEVTVAGGKTILEAAKEAGFTLQTECWGQGVCGRCKVKVEKGNVQKISHPKLSKEELTDNITLACQALIESDLEIFIPETTRFIPENEVVKTTEDLISQKVSDFLKKGLKFNPYVKKMWLRIDKPTLNDNSGDFERIKRELKREGIEGVFSCPKAVLETICDAVRKKNGEITILFFQFGNEIKIIDIRSGFDKDPFYGLSIDIGTTTVAVQLIDLLDSKVIGEKTAYNSQVPCGADIIHRIVFSNQPNGLKILNNLILKTLNNLITEICEENNIDPQSVAAVSAAGNTTMEHLFLKIKPRYIREEPYTPAVSYYPFLTAGEVGLDINPRAYIFIAPVAGSYVGGDVTAGILYSGLYNSDELTLYVDLGTNGEIVLGNREWMTAAACSAGPAFEGAGVYCGMRAVPGAIEKLEISKETDRIDYTVIGEIKPKGICGSAMIDLIHGLYFTGLINQKGRFNYDAKNPRFKKRDHYIEYVIVPSEETSSPGDIIINEIDLDYLIRTKGALWAGITTLLKEVGIRYNEIQKVIIAGGFGSFINIRKAIAIGMLPDLPSGRFSYVGNGSLKGASLALVSRDAVNKVQEITQGITYFDLSTTTGYMDEFIASLFIPHTDLNLFPSVKKKMKKQ